MVGFLPLEFFESRLHTVSENTLYRITRDRKEQAGACKTSFSSLIYIPLTQGLLSIQSPLLMPLWSFPDNNEWIKLDWDIAVFKRSALSVLEIIAGHCCFPCKWKNVTARSHEWQEWVWSLVLETERQLGKYFRSGSLQPSILGLVFWNSEGIFCFFSPFCAFLVLNFFRFSHTPACHKAETTKMQQSKVCPRSCNSISQG